MGDESRARHVLQSQVQALAVGWMIRCLSSEAALRLDPMSASVVIYGATGLP